MFSANARFDVSVVPVGLGTNQISVIVSGLDDQPLSDISTVKIKVSNPSRNIAPIEALVTENQVSSQQVITKYSAESTFSFAGTWQIELEAQRTANANESI